jgi:hypothetical protein
MAYTSYFGGAETELTQLINLVEGLTALRTVGYQTSQHPGQRPCSHRNHLICNTQLIQIKPQMAFCNYTNKQSKLITRHI